MAFNPDETILEGLTNYVMASGDKREVQAGSMVYKSMANGIRSHISPGDTCSLAFPSMIIRPEIRTNCFVVVLDSKVLVAWKKGLLRKTIEVEVLPKRQISGAEATVSNSGGTRGATLMTVQAEKSVCFALPKGRPDLTDAIRKAILAPPLS
jgi:hypothetical protein